MKKEKFILTDDMKWDGEICPFCGKKDVWFTNYINIGAPNLECRSCKKQWITCPKTNLEVKNIDSVDTDKFLHTKLNKEFETVANYLEGKYNDLGKKKRHKTTEDNSKQLLQMINTIRQALALVNKR